MLILIRIIKKFFYLLRNIDYNTFRKKYNIPRDFIFNGSDIKLYGEGKIIIGEKSHIGSYSTIQTHKGCLVKIGNNCRISHNVRIYTKSDDPMQDFSKKALEKKIGNVIIGDHSWIGVNSYIGPNVVIGKNCVVSANSVVTRNVKDFSIVAGVPAKIIKMKNE